MKNVASPIIDLQHISHHYDAKREGLWHSLFAKIGKKPFQESTTTVVHNVSLQIYPQEIVGLVGESGCGKSTIGRIVTGLIQPSEGTVSFQGDQVQQLSHKDYQKYQLQVQMIFQDPSSSLNPRMKIGNIIGEAAKIHGLVSHDTYKDYVAAQLVQAGLDPDVANRYPHQFSGGQRQRIGIARALAVQPSVLVCDEAVAALDVSISAQILNLFQDLRERLGLSFLFISHDLSVVRYTCDRIYVMYLGKIVESGTVQQVFEEPAHPYTQALIHQIPNINQRKVDFQPLEGELPSPSAPPSGCSFHPRCSRVTDRCRQEVPAVMLLSEQRTVACHLYS